MNQKSRNWCFTWNNPPADWWSCLMDIPHRYVIGGQEVGASGTAHIQGFISFSNPKTKRTVIALLPGCHVEKTMGTAAQAADYCKKEGNFLEDGDCPADPRTGSAERERWDRALELARSGRVEEIDADIQIRYYSALNRIASDHQPTCKSLVSVCGLWIHGPSGCGKSTLARALFPSAYPKPCNKWWDGFRTENAVILDDVDPTHASWIGYFLKIWADRFPFIAEIKGRSRKIRPQAIIVTSQFTISQVFTDAETRDAVRRRFQSFTFTPLALPTFNLVDFEQ